MAGLGIKVFETIDVLQRFGQLGVPMEVTFGLQRMENLMEEVLAVSLMDVLLVSLFSETDMQEDLEEGTCL
jgi:hypothetical protein